MFEKQAGKCAICEVLMLVSGNKGDSVHMDHSHETGKIRGLLCAQCNLGLGKFKDDHVRLRKAIAYLQAFEKAA
jgi:hypothetical protein